MIDGAAKADSIDPICIGDLGPLSVWSLDGLANSTSWFCRDVRYWPKADNRVRTAQVYFRG